jgi:hypothetical protein
MDHEPGGMTLSEEDRRLVGLWAADCAERALPLFEVKAPSDTRPREAIEGIQAFARGGSGKRDCAPLPGRLTPQRERRLWPLDRRPRSSAPYAESGEHA